jgi:hypothetical protein
MSKEEILDGYESTRVQMGYDHDDKADMWERGCIEQAMDDWAKVQSIAFAQWINDTNWGEEETWGKHDPPSMPTNEQLYNLFIEQSTKQ